MKNPPIRLTYSVLKVLKCLLESPGMERAGVEISKETNIGPGTIYPLLFRLEAASLVVGEWETLEPSEAKRPLRRFHRLTPDGRQLAISALKELTPKNLDVAVPKPA